MIKIENMTLEHLELIKDNLQDEFDDFWTSNILKSELENVNSSYIVAKENNKVIGFAGIIDLLDDAEITNIVIKKSERKKGIGSLLLEKLIEMAKELNKSSISLEVNENNIPAKSLYEKYGFKVVGIRKKYYLGKDDAIIMTKYF